MRVKDYVDNNFLLTYGDGLANVNIHKLIKFHREKNKLATVTIVKPQARFGSVKLKNNFEIESFMEKNSKNQNWINGGFFVLNKKIFKYLKSDNTIWENEPLKKLSSDNQLVGFKHNDFWQPMDTIREKEYLDELWDRNQAPWKIWK